MTPPVHPFRVIPCNEWGALPPRHPIVDAGVYDKAIFHHTSGHHPEFQPPSSGESYAEAEAYARAVQHSHFQRDWADTGNNFLVTRNGYIFEGRHRSLELLGRGHCPVSAHCVGQNGNPGVEFEHVDPEDMTPVQYAAGVWLFSRILSLNNLKPARIYGHKDFNATSCPSALYADLPDFRADVAAALKPKPAPYITPRWFVPWAEWWLAGADPDKRPAGIPEKIAKKHFLKLDRLGELYLEKGGNG